MKIKENKYDVYAISILLLFLSVVANYFAKYTVNRGDLNFIFSIVLSVVGHLGLPFFIMSLGNIFLSKKETNYIKNIIILVLTAVLFTFLNIIIFKKNYNIYSLLLNPLNSHLRVFYILLPLFIILPFLRNMVSNLDYKDARLFLILFLFFSGFLELLNLIKPFNYNMIIPLINDGSYVGYFILGYLLNKYKKEFFKLKICKYIISLITFVYLIVITYFRSKNYFGFNTFLLDSNNLIIQLFIIYSFIIIINKMNSKMLLNRIYPYLFLAYLFANIIFNFICYLNIYNYNAIWSLPLTYICLFISCFFVSFLLLLPFKGRIYE